MERTFPSANFPLPVPRGARPVNLSKPAGRPSAAVGADLQPADWQQYWDAREDVLVEGRGTFRVYTAGASGPVLLCLHGGGYCGLSWSLLAAHVQGAALRVVAPDLRGHGGTATGDDSDLSAGSMAADVAALWRALHGDAPPPVVVVGHSMGGAVAVHAAATKAIGGLGGVVVIDVVEGTALASLPHMRAVLAARPASFASPAAAIQWALRSGMSQSAEAACISVPGMLRPARDGDAAGGAASDCSGALAGIREEASTDGSSRSSSSAGGCGGGGNVGRTDGTGGPPAQGGGEGERWVWRAALAASERHWQGWYRGLSDAFLALPVPKALVLAGTDRLDKTLTIGQMQGKFQLVLLPQAGHAVHEDEAARVADTLQQFVARFRVGQPLPLPARTAASAAAPRAGAPPGG